MSSAGGWSIRTSAGLMDLAAPKLFGRHQFDNAGLAIATLRAIDAFRIDGAAFEAGIINAEWPARMQRLASGRLLDLAPPGCELWLDGGHNADGGRVVAAALGDLEERVSRPLVVIAGMMANKDAEGFLANFAGLTRHIIAVQIPDRDNAMAPDTLADAARHLGHAGGNLFRRRSGVAFADAAGLRSAAAHSHHRLALSRGPCAGRQRHAAEMRA